MSSTLVHFGLQGSLTRTFWPRAALLWIFIGAVIPDLGWIIQRSVRVLPISPDPYVLLSYAAILSSLGACLILGAAIALLTGSPGKVFAVLAISSLFHLLMDAAEIKWSNSVLLFAPLSWRFVRWDIIPQDGLIMSLLMIGSLVYVIVIWRTAVREWLAPRLFTGRLWLGSLVLAGLYLAWPLFWLDGPQANNVYDMAVLKVPAERPGKIIEFDRARYNHADHSIRIFSGERIRLENFTAPEGVLVSLRGTFLESDLLSVEESMIHPRRQRDLATKVGLVFLGGMMLHAAWLRWKQKGSYSRT